MSSFGKGLLAARSHLVFLVALVAGLAGVYALERTDLPQLRAFDVELSRDFDLPAPSQLTAEEMRWAKTAWKYIQNNTVPETGLVNSADNYPASTMWDTGSYLLGLISAERIGLVDTAEFDSRMSQVLSSLARLPLFDGQLPNKSYNTQTLAMVNYDNSPSARGIGWSAIDIGRLLVPFNVLVWHYPQHTSAVRAVVDGWDTTQLVRDATMFGAAVEEDGTTIYLQEGRLGYEEYSAKSFALLGLDVQKAARTADFLRYVDVYGVDVPTDERRPELYEAHNYVVSESYILDGLEFGWDVISEEFAYRVYLAQERRWENTGILTAVSEDNIDQAPFFVYNTVFTDGKIWNAITEDGEDASEFKTLSTKAALGWHGLLRTEYTQVLAEEASELFDPERGFFSGRYEVTGEPNRAITCNTNSIILESLAYRLGGPLLGLGAS